MWTLRCIQQYFACGYLVRGEATTRGLAGHGSNPGWVAFLMYKQELLDYLTSGFIDGVIADAEKRKAIRQVLSNHQTHHTLFGWPKELFTVQTS